MRHLGTAAQIWISMVLLGGGVALGVAGLHVAKRQALTELDSPTLWVFLAAAAVTHAFPSIAPRHQAYHASQSFLMAGVLLLSWPAVALIILVAHAAEWARRPRPRYIQLYNVGGYLLSTGAAAATFALLSDAPFALGDPRLIAAAAAAAGAFLLVNHGLTAIVLRLARGVSLVDSGLFGRKSLGFDGGLLLVGVVMAGAWLIQPLTLIVTGAPLAIVYGWLPMTNVEVASHRDQLTGLYNARHFVEAFDLELRRARRPGHPTAVIVLALDDVPGVVRRYGRATLDFLMSAVAQRVGHAVRDYDLLARLDDGALGLLLPASDLERAQAMASRLGEVVRREPYTLATTREPVIASARLSCTSVMSGAERAADILATVRRDAERAVFAGPPVEVGRTSVSQPRTQAPAGTTTSMAGTAPLRPVVRLELFEALVILPALAITATVLATASNLPSLPLTGGILGLVLLSEVLAFELYDRSSFSISFAPVLAAGLLGGAPATLLATWSVAVLRGLVRRSRWDKVLFNGSAFSLTGLLATWAATAGGRLSISTGQLAPLLAATALASAAYYLHTFLIAGALSLDLGADPRRVWVRNFRWLFPHYALLGWMGLGLAVATLEIGPLGSALFLAPPLAMRFVLKQYTDRTSAVVGRLEATNAELRAASTQLEERGEELALLSDLGQLTVSEPRSESLPALVVSRCVPTLGEVCAVVWQGPTCLESAVQSGQGYDGVAAALKTHQPEDMLSLAERVSAGVDAGDWIDGAAGDWLAEPLSGTDRRLGWILAWHASGAPEDDTSRHRDLMREVARRLALVLERDTLLEEAANLDALRAVDRAKTDFIATTAHELRTPLTSLQGYTELLVNDIDPALRDRWLRILHLEATQLGQVLDQLLDVSRLDSGRFQADRRAFEFGDVAQHVVDSVAEQSAMSGHALGVEVDDVPQVYADPAQVERVLRNLLSNAIKYTPGGGLIRIVATERGASDVEVFVEDPGLGIPAEWLGRLFERFQRVDLPERASIRGTGLGLYIARQLVELNGGRIWTTSEGIGRGSTFHFTLPRAPRRPSLPV